MFSVLLSILFTGIRAQESLSYYLPPVSYDRSIPDPEAVLGFLPGQWHLTHDQLVRYLFTLAEKSDRMILREYGRSYEQRPMFVLMISHPDNLARLDEIRAERRVLWSGEPVGEAQLRDMPGVLYQGYSVHGNEPSGGNAAALVAYFLAADRSAETDSLLRRNIVILDPCFNPDGFNRFANWVNQSRSLLPNSDDNSRELNEPWPGGRTNHYWFDLNRDYLTAQHPETAGRIRLFREWMPEIFTDHHEMGSNASFFFQPGIPSRVHPLTPAENQALTAEVGGYHEAALNEINSLYFTKESYDDYFYGKGSTYPDINGGVGILFEQASSRGHLRETVNGPLSFPFTIRNQVATSFSTHRALVAMREKLLRYKSEFFAEALRKGRADGHAGVLIGSRTDAELNRELIRVMLLHDIELWTVEGGDYPYFVPYAQVNYGLVKSFFEERRAFPDSLFYDISAWPLHRALGLPAAYAERRPAGLGARVDSVPAPAYRMPADAAEYAYLIEWGDYLSPAGLWELLESGVRVKFAERPFTAVTDGGAVDFAAGSLLVPLQGSKHHPRALWTLLKRVALSRGLKVYSVATGMSLAGPDLGSNHFAPVERPVVGILSGRGVNAYETGALWHLLEQRYGMRVTVLDPDRLSEAQLERYTHLLLCGGVSEELQGQPEGLRRWVSAGGTLIATGAATGRLGSIGLPAPVGVEPPDDKADGEQWIPYGERTTRSGAKRLSGSVFRVELDLTHPACFGYSEPTIAAFRRGTRFFRAQGTHTPARFAEDFHIAGYLPRDTDKTAPGAAYLSILRQGRGRIVCFADTPNFRSYFWGTNKLLANTLFFDKAF